LCTTLLLTQQFPASNVSERWQLRRLEKPLYCEEISVSSNTNRKISVCLATGASMEGETLGMEQGGGPAAAGYQTTLQLAGLAAESQDAQARILHCHLPS